MSDADVEVVRSSFEAWNTGDLEAWAAYFAPDVVIGAPAGWPEAGADLVGRAAWIAQARLLTDSWEEQRIDPDEITSVGDRVLALFTWVTRGKDSGIDFETQMASVNTVRNGLITRAEYFMSRDAALDAAGGEDVHRSP